MYQTNSLNQNTGLVLNERMDSDERPRSIRFPQWLWDELDRDAMRCKRSSTKQLEVVLTAYYRGDMTLLNADRLSQMLPGASLKPSQIQMAPERNGNKEGKKTKAA